MTPGFRLFHAATRRPGALLVTVMVLSWAGHDLVSAAEPAADAQIRVDDFYIDRYEYPNVEGQMPRVDVSFDEAARLCAQRGKRLCTEREWELASGGPLRAVYGYGDRFLPGRCNTPQPDDSEGWVRTQGTQPSGTYPECISGAGAVDMIGNVWEWVDGWYDRDKGWRVVRGGSWFHNLNYARTDGRYGRGLTSDFRLDLIGFRCCRSAGP